MNLNDTYDSDTDNLLEDLVRPALSCSKLYLRSVGYLDAKMFCRLGLELEQMAKTGGQIKILVGLTVDVQQYEAIKAGELEPDRFVVIPNLDKLWESERDDATRRGLLLTSWLIGKRILDVRFSVRPKGIHHEKFALYRDNDGHEVIAHGTHNETEAANLAGINKESLSVFRSWEKGIYDRFGEPKLESFLRSWGNHSPASITVKPPSAILDRFFNFSQGKDQTSDYQKLHSDLLEDLANQEVGPRIPFFWGEERYALKAHQLEAIVNWEDNDYQGIFRMATGSGKTIAALHAATLLGQRVVEENEVDFFIVVSVPYEILADQWVENFEHYGYRPIRAYGARDSWYQSFEDLLTLAERPKGRLNAIVVINRTLQGEAFQSLVRDIPSDRLMFVADECHRVGNLIAKKRLPDADYLIGLSATPWARREQELRGRLLSYFGSVVANYSLANAFADKVLVPYEYFVKEVCLKDDETERYSEHATAAKKLYAQKQSGMEINDTLLNFHLNQKGAIIGSCREKFDSLTCVLDWMAPRTKLRHLLIYCGSGSSSVHSEQDTPGSSQSTRDIELAQSTARAGTGLQGSKITHEENARQRKMICESFSRGSLHAIFAIRVLDEGFDMPSIRGAVLMASSRNERQFIQRRGRVLRTAPGKSKAFIADFFVFPPATMDVELGKELVKDELARIIEFSNLALNSENLDGFIERVGKEYALDIEELTERLRDETVYDT